MIGSTRESCAVRIVNALDADVRGCCARRIANWGSGWAGIGIRSAVVAKEIISFAIASKTFMGNSISGAVHPVVAGTGGWCRCTDITIAAVGTRCCGSPGTAGACGLTGGGIALGGTVEANAFGIASTRIGRSGCREHSRRGVARGEVATGRGIAASVVCGGAVYSAIGAIDVITGVAGECGVIAVFRRSCALSEFVRRGVFAIIIR